MGRRSRDGGGFREYRGVRSVQPCSEAESEFVTSVAQAVGYATALVADEPERRGSRNSLGEFVRSSYGAFRPDDHVQRQLRARELLTGSVEQRRRYFGRHAERAAEEIYGESWLDRDTRTLLREAVGQRLGRQRGDLDHLLELCAAAKPPKIEWTVTHTFLEGWFGGENPFIWSTITISYPQVLGFRWQTDEADAEIGVWQLFLMWGDNEILIGSGYAGSAPGPQEFRKFFVDLSNELPAKPPSAPAVYHLRVVPMTKPTYLPAESPGGLGPKVPGHQVGLPSEPVTITYSAYSFPDLTVSFHDIYRKLQFDVLSITMVSEQTEWGAEEFHIAGFVQELFPIKSDLAPKQIRFGPSYAELDIDGPTSQSIPDFALFHLNNPDQINDWPRAYAVVVSVMEEDDGGSLNEWLSQLWLVADAVLSGPVSSEISQYLQDYVDTYLQENLLDLLDTSAQLANTVASLIGNAVSGIVGMIVAVAALIIAGVVSGQEDDFYGAGVHTFVLPTNLKEALQYLDGDDTPQGFVVKTSPIGLGGHTQWPHAAAIDGWIEISYRWRLQQIEVFED